MANKPNKKGDVLAPHKPSTSQALVTAQPQPMVEVAWDTLKALGFTVQRKGEIWQNKKGENKVRAADVLVMPTVKALRERMPELASDDAAKQWMKDIGLKIKPEVMAEVNRAGSNGSYIVKRFVNKRTEDTHDLAVSLHRVNIESTIERFAREQGKSVEEVQKLMGIETPGTTVNV